MPERYITQPNKGTFLSHEGTQTEACLGLWVTSVGINKMVDENVTCLLIDVRISGLDTTILLFPFLLIDVRISRHEATKGEKKAPAF